MEIKANLSLSLVEVEAELGKNEKNYQVTVGQEYIICATRLVLSKQQHV